MNSFVTVQRQPLSPMPVAPATIASITPRLNHIPDPSDMDPPPIPLSPPPLTKTVAKKFLYPFIIFQTPKAIGRFKNILWQNYHFSCAKKFNEPVTFINTPNVESGFDISSDTISPLFPSSSSSFLSTSSVEGFLNCESEDSLSNNTLTYFFQRITHSFKLTSTPIQSSSSSCTRSTSSSISAMMLHHAQSQFFAFGSASVSRPVNPLSLRPSSGIKTSFLVLSYPKSAHLIEDQESVPSPSAIKAAELAYQWLYKISRLPTLDLYLYPPILDNWNFNHPRQDQILPVNRKKTTVCKIPLLLESKPEWINSNYNLTKVGSECKVHCIETSSISNFNSN